MTRDDDRSESQKRKADDEGDQSREGMVREEDRGRGEDGQVATAEEIINCSIAMADWADVSDYTRDYMYKFGKTYW